MATTLSDTLFPLVDLIQRENFPLAAVLPEDALETVLDGLYYTEAEGFSAADNLVLRLNLTFEGEIALQVPGVRGFALVIGSASPGWTDVDCELVVGPDAELTLRDVSVALRVPKAVLRNVAKDGPAEIGFMATLSIDTGWNLSLKNRPNAQPAEVRGCGQRRDYRGNRRDLELHAGADVARGRRRRASGRVPWFRLERSRSRCRPISPTGRSFLRLLLHRHGRVHRWRLDDVCEPPACNLGGFLIELERVGLRFQAVPARAGEMAAVLRKLDFFETDVAVDLRLAAGELQIALSAAADRQAGHAGASVTPAGLLTLTKPDVVAITLTAAALDVSAAAAALTLSGTITPLFSLPGGSALPGFEVEALTITSKGAVSVDGGWIDLPASTRVGLGGFALELTRAGLGSEPNGERWVGFSGTLRLVEGVPITAAVDGLKVRWDDTGLKGVELAGVKLAFEIENVMRLDARIRHIASQGRFEGAGTLELIALNLTVSARVVIGKRADYTYLYIYLLVQPPVGVPIFNTGLAFYSFEALYARHMKPGKTGAERWFEDWYRRPELGVVDQKKWVDEQGSQAFGAGITLGTLADKGYSVAVKGLLVVVVPGPVLLLDARANLLRDPSSLAAPDTQAIFSALVVYDGPNGTLEAAVEPHYMFPDEGELVDVTGIAEAFYSFNDPRAWHLYLGRREREQRIRARLFSLFDANAYLMLEPDALELGGFIGYKVEYTAGPAALTLEAFIEGSALISLRPKQFRGELHLQATVRIAVAGVGVGATASAILVAQAPQPFAVDGTVKVRADLPWPLPDVGASAELHWEAPGPPRRHRAAAGGGHRAPADDRQLARVRDARRAARRRR